MYIKRLIKSDELDEIIKKLDNHLVEQKAWVKTWIKKEIKK